VYFNNAQSTRLESYRFSTGLVSCLTGIKQDILDLFKSRRSYRASVNTKHQQKLVFCVNAQSTRLESYRFSTGLVSCLTGIKQDILDLFKSRRSYRASVNTKHQQKLVFCVNAQSTRLELATSRVTGGCSNQLSYDCKTSKSIT
jgi:uncharacterized C2H2 Zn-finger protein